VLLSILSLVHPPRPKYPVTNDHRTLIQTEPRRLGWLQLLISANGVGIGTGALDASDKLVVNGPIRISDGGTRPICTQSHRGMIWYVPSALV
jgi:hypothetical protein